VTRGPLRRFDRQAERRLDLVLVLQQHERDQTERDNSHQREGERSENVDHDLISQNRGSALSRGCRTTCRVSRSICSCFVRLSSGATKNASAHHFIALS